MDREIGYLEAIYEEAYQDGFLDGWDSHETKVLMEKIVEDDWK